jgi:S1-C subfamily serine protease
MANTLVDFSNCIADAVERAGQSIVAIREGGAHGVSGTLWAPDVIVAAEHTIRGQEELTAITLPSGRSAKGKVAGRDPGTDLAVIKLAEQGGVAAELADTVQARVGHVVLAVGRREDGLSASYGVISAIGGPWRTWRGARVDRYFRLDLLPYPGFSGGPLIDAQGRVLGINTSGPRRSVLTIPASTVDRVVRQLLEKGRVSQGYLGAGFQPVRLPKGPGNVEGQHGLGLLVVKVVPEGPAERGGLLVGDIVLALDGKALADPADVQTALDPETVGKAVTLQLLRGGKAAEIGVTIGERPWSE